MIRLAIPYILAAVIASAGVWWIMSMKADNAALRTENERIKLTLAGCTARAANRSEDKESDNAVDNMPDLRAVPDHWLLPGPGGGGLY